MLNGSSVDFSPAVPGKNGRGSPGKSRCIKADLPIGRIRPCDPASDDFNLLRRAVRRLILSEVAAISEETRG